MKKWIAAEIVELNIAETAHGGGGNHHDKGDHHNKGGHHNNDKHHQDMLPTPDNNVRPPMPSDDGFVDDLS